MIRMAHILGLALAAGIVGPSSAEEQAIQVTLLGTGCPPAAMNRFGPSTLVRAGSQSSGSRRARP
jgi:ribonuclease Z